ncbi:MAG: SGNH/GDSL hydrolase family protein, partial [Clostridia bacterium]
ITGASDGAIYIEGLIAYNPIVTTPKGCYVHNVGTPTRKASEYALQASKTPSVLTPHLTIIAFSINDAKASATDYYASMSSLISANQNAGASVLLVAYYAINDTPAINANYLAMNSQMYQLCDQFNCAMVDIYSRWGKDFTVAQLAGLMGTSDWSGNAGSDAWHVSDKGHREIANAIAINLIGQI